MSPIFEAPQSMQIAIVVVLWVGPHLNPAIWEAIAGTGFHSDKLLTLSAQ